MAGFCTKCGRPLQDGVPCSCTQTQSNAQQATFQQTNNQQGAYQQTFNQQQNYQQANGNETFDKATAQAGEYLNKLTDVSKGLFGTALNLIKRPYDTTKSIIQGNAKTFGIQAIVAKAVIIAVLMLAFFMYLDSQTYGEMDAKFKFLTPLFTALIAVAIDFMLAGSMMLSTMLFKKPEKFETMLGIAGIKAVLDTLAIVGATVIGLLNGTLGGYVLVVGSLISFLFVIMAFNLSSSIDENKKIYAMAVAILFTAVGIYILFKLCFGPILNMIGLGRVSSLFGYNMFNSFY